MNREFYSQFDQDYSITSLLKLSEWKPLNDSIMGGESDAVCNVIKEGLVLQGQIVEEGGGFVSCRSQLFSPPLDLSSFKGIDLD